ncbi:putative transcriptional elongation regulator Elc1/Elongin C [Neohortaea acidophila]|uniref:Elongin-C n=1 Tax=Neohortaea acidophila TaxID=245834 RepID=A0A6A6PTZ5_9PEZI|nr:putative transcriptional elongation regulator Elc1/Elongin C [Neohortaea acidophila]KAF2483161.1 putative transcriptional elongation regulator Elc1/Elongin C [Neohortaea acidophila]
MSSELTDYVTLVSSDGFSFVVQRSCACISGAIKRMLDPAYGFTESRTNTCRFENMSGAVLEKVCEYFYYKEKYQDAKDAPDMDFPLELALELLIAADYLDV